MYSKYIITLQWRNKDLMDVGVGEGVSFNQALINQGLIS